MPRVVPRYHAFAEEIHVHPLREHGQAHHEEKEEVPDTPKPGRRHGAGHGKERDQAPGLSACARVIPAPPVGRRLPGARPSASRS